MIILLMKKKKEVKSFYLHLFVDFCWLRTKEKGKQNCSNHSFLVFQSLQSFLTIIIIFSFLIILLPKSLFKPFYFTFKQIKWKQNFIPMRFCSFFLLILGVQLFVINFLSYYFLVFISFYPKQSGESKCLIFILMDFLSNKKV